MAHHHHRERHARPALPTTTAPRAWRLTDSPSPEAVRAAALVLYARLACADMGVDPDGAESELERRLTLHPLE
jgi:hypothetical protein